MKRHQKNSVLEEKCMQGKQILAEMKITAIHRMAKSNWVRKKKDADWLQAGELYLNAYAHCFSGNHSKEIRNFKYNIVSWYLCASWSSVMLITTCTAIVSYYNSHLSSPWSYQRLILFLKQIPEKVILLVS